VAEGEGHRGGHDPITDSREAMAGPGTTGAGNNVIVHARRPAGLRRSVSWGPIPLGTILVTVGTVVAVYLLGKLLYRLGEVVLIMVVGAFVALLLNPLVLALQRWGVRWRGLAVAIVTVASIFIFGGIAFALGSPLVSGLTHFANALPTYVKDAEHGHGWIGHLVRRYHIESWVEKNSPKIISFAQSLTKPILSVAKGAVSGVGSLVLLFFFVILLLLEAPKMKTALLDTLSPDSAERWRRVGNQTAWSVGRYMLGNVTTSVLAGVVVFSTLAVLSVPYPQLWGIWVALVDFLPEVGGALAGIPTVLFAFTHSLSAGIVTAIVFLIYWQLENRILTPIIMSRTVRINPLLVFVAVIVAAAIGIWVGGAFGGFAAALIAIPAAASGQAVVRELRHSFHESTSPTRPGRCQGDSDE
jgi:predicted PurR-regulated permease PerM